MSLRPGKEVIQTSQPSKVLASSRNREATVPRPNKEKP